MNDYSMTVSKAISELQKILEEKGDIPIAALSYDSGYSSKVHLVVDAEYFDGGYYAPLIDTVHHCNNWISKRSANKFFVRILVDEPDDNDSIDGKKYCCE